MPFKPIGVYKQIKKRVKEGLDRSKIPDEIMEAFGDKNPDVNTLFKTQVNVKNKINNKRKGVI